MDISKRTWKNLVFLLTPLLVWGCSEGSTSPDADEFEETPVAYVERSTLQVASTSNPESSSSVSVNLGSPYDYSYGAKLKVRSGISAEADVTDVLTSYFGSGSYDVKDLNVSEDGRFLLFAAHGPDDDPRNNTWNIFEYDFVEKSLRRVIEDNELANAGQDTSPAYSGNGKIVFSSDRNAGNEALGLDDVVIDEENCVKISPNEKPSLLHSMTREGSDIVQLTTGANHDTKTTTLKDGTVAFVRWSRSYELLENCDSIGMASNSNYLFSISGSLPAGLRSPEDWTIQEKCAYAQESPVGPVLASNHYTLLSIDVETLDLKQLYDTVTVAGSDAGFLQLNKIVQSNNGRLFALIKHAYNEFNGGSLQQLNDPHSSDPEKIYGGLNLASLSNEVNLYPNQVSLSGWYSAFWPYRDGTSRVLISWSKCTARSTGVDEFCEADDNSVDVNASYGIWVLDTSDGSHLPIVPAQRNTVYSELAMGHRHEGAALPFEPFNEDYVPPVVEEGRVICSDPGVVEPVPEEDPTPGASSSSSSSSGGSSSGGSSSGSSSSGGSSSGGSSSGGSSSGGSSSGGSTSSSSSSSGGSSGGGSATELRSDVFPVPEPEFSGPNVMFVLDRSGSMSDNWKNGVSGKWSSLISVVDNVVTGDSSGIQFGALLYPAKDATRERSCDVNTGADNYVPLSASSESAIQSVLAETSPRGGTPTRLAIDTAVTLFPEDHRPRAIILVTDGMANCQYGTGREDEYDIQVHDAVSEAYLMYGIPTYVVGIEIESKGETADKELMNQLAIDGGVPKTDGNSYYDVDDTNTLQSALDDIAVRVESDAYCHLSLSASVASDLVVKRGTEVIPSTDSCEQSDTGYEWEASQQEVRLCEATCDSYRNGTESIEVIYQSND